SIEQAQLLIHQGCHMLQGFLYGYAISAEEVVALLQRSRQGALRVASKTE
ncbi:MAG: hypothetical protein RIR70_379, partial [Pseudomonadota bacterium]